MNPVIDAVMTWPAALSPSEQGCQPGTRDQSRPEGERSRLAWNSSARAPRPTCNPFPNDFLRMFAQPSAGHFDQPVCTGVPPFHGGDPYLKGVCQFGLGDLVRFTPGPKIESHLFLHRRGMEK